MRARQVLAAGAWDTAREVDRVLLDYDHRHRRRILLRTEQGNELVLDLAQAIHLHAGDGLLRDDSGVVRVCARAEELMEIRAEPAALLRIAWHLGNRHLPVQFLPERLRVRSDPVIADMVRGLGGEATPIEAPFDPEPGAYAAQQHPHG